MCKLQQLQRIVPFNDTWKISVDVTYLSFLSSAFLAEELKYATHVTADHHGNGSNSRFCVVAMDQRYRSMPPTDNNSHGETSTPEEECCMFWRRRKIEDVTRCVSVQWRNSDQDEEYAIWFQRESSQKSNSRPGDIHRSEGQHVALQRHVLCLYMVRFWNRPLAEFLVKSALVKEGTLVAISQFAKSQPGASWNFEHPKVSKPSGNCMLGRARRLNL